MYTVTASLPLLLAICIIFYSNNSTFIPLNTITLPHQLSSSIGPLLLLSAFLVKLPLFSVHLWLPKAHVEAPVAGSIVLAAILLKLGGYGIIRVAMLFPKSLSIAKFPVIRIALIGAIITRIICLRQSDIKSLIAYSSIGHIGLIVAGIITGTT